MTCADSTAGLWGKPDYTLSVRHRQLGSTLWERFKREGSFPDIANAIEQFSTAIDLADRRDPAYSRNIAGLKLDLGTAILQFGRATASAEMLGGAIECFRDALRHSVQYL